MIHGRETPKLVEQLVLQQIELVFSVAPMEHPEVRVELLCKVPLVCIMPPGHRLVARREIHCKDLAGERFASFRHDSAVRRRSDQAFEDAKVMRRIALEAPMAPAICAAVARGLGVSVVNPVYVGAFAPALVMRPFRPRIESSIFMAMRRGRRNSQLAEAFAAASREVAEELQQSDGAIAFRYG
jgi:DNA-binding transcriptional LysR family regulator